MKRKGREGERGGREERGINGWREACLQERA